MWEESEVFLNHDEIDARRDIDSGLNHHVGADEL